MVAIDDSVHAYYAFQFAISSLNPQTDQLFLLNVAIEPSGYMSILRDVSLLAKAQVKQAKKVLAFYKNEADKLGICSAMILGQYRHVGETICLIAEEVNIDYLILGRRSMIEMARLLVGSTSRFAVDNASCHVAIVRPPRDLTVDEYLTNEALAGSFDRFHIKTTGVSLSVAENTELQKISQRSEDKTFLYIYRGPTETMKKKEVVIVSKYLGESNKEPITEEIEDKAPLMRDRDARNLEKVEEPEKKREKEEEKEKKREREREEFDRVRELEREVREKLEKETQQLKRARELEREEREKLEKERERVEEEREKLEREKLEKKEKKDDVKREHEERRDSRAERKEKEKAEKKEKKEEAKKEQEVKKEQEGKKEEVRKEHEIKREDSATKDAQVKKRKSKLVWKGRGDRKREEEEAQAKAELE